MGLRASKLANSSTVRKYPATVTAAAAAAAAKPSRLPPAREPGAAVAAAPSLATARYEKDDVIKRDAADPDFASMLRRVGPVRPVAADLAARAPDGGAVNLQVKTLRQRLRIEEEQMEDAGRPGERRWVDVGTLKEILRRRDRDGWVDERIEKEFGLKRGTMERLGTSIKNV